MRVAVHSLAAVLSRMLTSRSSRGCANVGVGSGSATGSSASRRRLPGALASAQIALAGWPPVEVSRAAVAMGIRGALVLVFAIAVQRFFFALCGREPEQHRVRWQVPGGGCLLVRLDFVEQDGLGFGARVVLQVEADRTAVLAPGPVAVAAQPRVVRRVLLVRLFRVEPGHQLPAVRT